MINQRNNRPKPLIIATRFELLKSTIVEKLEQNKIRIMVLKVLWRREISKQTPEITELC